MNAPKLTDEVQFREPKPSFPSSEVGGRPPKNMSNKVAPSGHSVESSVRSGHEDRVTNGRDPNTPRTFKERTLEILDDRYFVTVMTVATVYALFADDFRLLALKKTDIGGFYNDDIFSGISCVVLGMFLIELVMSCIARPGYAPDCKPQLSSWARFYFWLDLVSTLSILPDIGWVQEIIFASGDSGSGDLKTTRSARVARVVRVVRLVRLVRLVKLYKMHNRNDEESSKSLRSEPSKVGNKLSDLTMRRLIVLILTVLFILPQFDGGLEPDVGQKYQQDGLQSLHSLWADAYYHTSPDMTPQQKNDLLRANVLDYARVSGRLLNMRIGTLPADEIHNWISTVKFKDCSTCDYDRDTNPENDWSPKDYEKNSDDVFDHFRETELSIVNVVGCRNDENIYKYDIQGQENNDECTSWAVFDIRVFTAREAGFNMVKTLFIMFMMVLGGIMFQQDAQILVIGPIERMMDMVRRLAENPMGATQTDDDMLDEDKRAKKKGYETALLESTLTKVGSLLQVGFGAAGAEIIAHNMAQGGDVDPMVPGKLITSVYGFCDIRQFTDTTECLQEEVMVYVNKLGDIIHGCTHNYYGMANKNIGDAFLLSWKVCDGELEGFSNFLDAPSEDLRQKALKVRCPPNMGAGTKNRRINPTEMADSALTAFLKGLINLDNANETGNLNVYRHNKRVKARFGDNFKIKMGFGMHVGWAIEGAIGTTYKIDATYLSPQVEMSDRLEAGSKIFGVPVNLSHWFVALLSPAARNYLRPIDCISVGGCPTPMTVYTYDVIKMKEDFGVPKFLVNGEQIPVDFENDPQYAEIQEGLNPDFKSTFMAGYKKYIEGNWSAAKDFLESADQLMISSGKTTGDGPSRQLLKFMESYGFIKPENWKGVHVMDGY